MPASRAAAWNVCQRAMRLVGFLASRFGQSGLRWVVHRRPKFDKDWSRQWHSALFFALANDLYKTINAVDRRDLEPRSLTDAQAASVHEQQGSSGDRVPYAAKD